MKFPPCEYEQIFRVGWPATAGGCSTQNSRYPSLWIDDDKGAVPFIFIEIHSKLNWFAIDCVDIFHLSISDDDNCGRVGMILYVYILCFLSIITRNRRINHRICNFKCCIIPGYLGFFCSFRLLMLGFGVYIMQRRKGISN